MPAIYSTEWYEAMFEFANSYDEVSSKMPQGEFNMAVEVNGDGKSPYVPEGVTKHYFVRFMDGKVTEYRESKEKIPGKGLSFRVSGPASAFDGMAAGITDPISAGLDGTLTIRGDMRFIMQNADIMEVVMALYTESDVTEWPKGMPPY